MITIYGMSASGNCYKLQLLCELLQLKYRWIEVDILRGETHTHEFLAINPNAKVPVLVLDNGRSLPESNAGLFYLANGSRYFPNQPFAQAETLQWMFFEQYSHEPAIAVARFIKKFLPTDHPRNAELKVLHQKGYQALEVMEQRLKSQKWMSNQEPSIADIALFAYTHKAHEGGFDLSSFSAILNWIDAIQSLPHFHPMQT